jgi:hypothetical protein
MFLLRKQSTKPDRRTSYARAGHRSDIRGLDGVTVDFHLSLPYHFRRPSFCPRWPLPTWLFPDCKPIVAATSCSLKYSSVLTNLQLPSFQSVCYWVFLLQVIGPESVPYILIQKYNPEITLAFLLIIGTVPCFESY